MVEFPLIKHQVWMCLEVLLMSRVKHLLVFADLQDRLLERICFLSRLPALTWKHMFGARWVCTSSTSPRQRSYAARPCVVLTAAVFARIQTARFTCTWTPSPTASRDRTASWRSPVNSEKRTSWACRRTSNVSATAVFRGKAVNRPTRCAKEV